MAGYGAMGVTNLLSHSTARQSSGESRGKIALELETPLGLHEGTVSIREWWKWTLSRIGGSNMRKWYSLIDKVYARDNLHLAFKRVKANNGAPGIDGETVKDFQACFEENLAAIHAELKTNTYQPSPVRRVEIEKEGNCHPNPRGGPWAYSKSHQNTHHVTMGRMGTASNRPESLPSGMDSIFPASQLPKAPSGSHGMDPQKTTDEEDAGMEKLERSAQNTTPTGLPW